MIVLSGLLQGTFPGPQTYILYAADLESLPEKHRVKIHLYTDDTQLYYHSRTNNLEQAMVKFEGCLVAQLVERPLVAQLVERPPG